MKMRWVIFIILISINISYAKETVYWYLAASMTKPGQAVVNSFNAEDHPFEVQLILGGSGQLLSRIVSSGKGDLYTPASAGFMNKAIQKKLVKTQIVLLYQTPVFGLSEKSKGKILTFDDLGKEGVRIALGKPKTMALGAVYSDMEVRMGQQMWDAIQKNKVMEAINVSQIVNYIKSGIVDAGIVFDSTAKANGMDYIALPESVNQKIEVSTAVLAYTKHRKEVATFLGYLGNSGDIFKKYGFEFVMKP